MVLISYFIWFSWALILKIFYKINFVCLEAAKFNKLDVCHGNNATRSAAPFKLVHLLSKLLVDDGGKSTHRWVYFNSIFINWFRMWTCNIVNVNFPWIIKFKPIGSQVYYIKLPIMHICFMGAIWKMSNSKNTHRWVFLDFNWHIVSLYVHYCLLHSY